MDKYHFSDEQRLLLESLETPFAIYQFLDRRVVTLILSNGFLELFGYENHRERAYRDMDNDMYRDTHPDDAARIADAAYQFAVEDGKYDVIYRSRKKGGEGYRIIHAMGRHVFTDSGVRLAHVWYFDEGVYTKEQGAQRTQLNLGLKNALYGESILKASYYDHLTGLPTMVYFFELAEAGKEAMLKAGQHPAMLFLDLCGMEYYNLHYGFEGGNQLLQAFGRLLSATFSAENCSRFGQDHFAVFTHQEGLEDTLRGLFAECQRLNGGSSLPVRVGIYPDQIGSVSASTACDRAKLACDAVRNTFVSCFEYYNPHLRDQEEMRLYLLANLDRAIAEKWIQVYYQPIIRAVNGKVCDEEALTRWIDPNRGFLSPGEFIPVLENARLLYKLDLYVVEQVLEKLKLQKAAGLHVVPQSVNLSRSDFDACDIVEEIYRRVDASGIGRDLLTIEVTESIVGRDFDFMKQQIERFRELGFAVWMDDFGSGYSSLDMLQSIKFDLIKFDMLFMKQFDESNGGRIILTELMKMATALGLDTVCEGVETDKQVRFLQEIGCSKLQGFYYTQALPLEKILERYEKGQQIGFENPAEAAYYESIGRVNLFDLEIMSKEDINSFQNFFSTLPMGIIELNGDKVRFVRSNQSFRDFMKRFYGNDLSRNATVFTDAPFGTSANFISLIRQYHQGKSRAFFDYQVEDSVAHVFIRRIGVNPVSGTAAVGVAILSLVEADKGASYANIARALAADYYNLYYVDLETEDFIEYTSPVGGEELALERHGRHFFQNSRKDAAVRIYQEDRDAFIAAFTKENVLRELDRQGTFALTYRLLDTGRPLYASMKIMRMKPEGKYIIIGVSTVDSQMRQKEQLDRIYRDQISSARIMALSGEYICLYTINPETGRYAEYVSSSEYEQFGLAKCGEDFFADSRINGEQVLLPEDLDRYRKEFTKENILRTIARDNLFTFSYHLPIKGVRTRVMARAALVKERDGDKLILGVLVTDKKTDKAL